MKQPPLHDYHPAAQLAIFVGIATVSMIVFTLLSLLVVVPFYGVDPLSVGGYHLEDPNAVGALKVLQLFNALGLFIVPPVIFVWLAKKFPIRYLCLHRYPRPATAILSAAMIIAALPVINWMAEVNSYMYLPDWLSGLENWMRQAEAQAAELTEAFLKMEGIGDLLFNIFLIALLPAVGEELLFRGVVQRLLTKWSGSVHMGIWIAAILFSALHGQFFGFLPRMVLGAMLGYIMVWSGSLWLPILVHFVNNGGAVVIAYLVGQEALSKDVEDIGAGNGEFSTVLASVVFTGGLLFLIYRNEKRRRRYGIH